MDQVRAARETLDMIDARLTDWTLDVGVITKLPSTLQLPHLTDMVVMMEQDNNPSGGIFSEGKLGRWLGWIQAAGVAMGVLTLEECKGINRRWSL